MQNAPESIAVDLGERGGDRRRRGRFAAWHVVSSIRVERLRRDLPLARLLGSDRFMPATEEVADAPEAFVLRYLRNVKTQQEQEG